MSVARSRTTGTTRGRVYRAALALVLAITAILLVFLASREFIDYDSYWHVFIARQDRWPNFWYEVRENAHPPLFYLLLRAASSWLGPNLLAYRVVSISATVVATGLVAAIVRRTTASRALAIVAAAAFGLSYGVIMTGLEVRAYSLCAAFTLLAFVCYLDWLRTPVSRLSAWTCAGFACAAAMAVVTHYNAFFFIAAAIGTPLVLAVAARGWRRRLLAKIAARPVATLLMFATPVVVAAAAYVVHVALWGGGRLNHVPAHMFDPRTETPWTFLLRNTLNLAAVLLPGGDEFIAGVFNWRQWLALVVIGGVSLVGLARLGRARSPRLAAVPIVSLALMLALNAIGGLAGRYPYGGAPRHEFFLVPFGLVGFFTLIEAARRGLRHPYDSRRLWMSVVACGVAASVASWSSTFRVERDALFQTPMNRFRGLIASPRAVLLDRFTFIAFFSHHHDWRWRLAGEWWNGQAVWQLWSVNKADRTVAICRESQWSLDMSSITTYDSVVECGQRSGAHRVAIFRTQWSLQQPGWDTSKIALFIESLSADDGLTPTVLGSDGGDVYAEFDVNPARWLDCSGPPLPPTDFRVVSNSSRVVALSWAPSSSARTSYFLEAGRAPGLTDVVNVPLGRATTYTASQVNPATYYARVRARNTCGVSAPSADIRVTVED